LKPSHSEPSFANTPSITSSGVPNVDASGHPLAQDFLSFWSAGQMALKGHPAAAYFCKHPPIQMTDDAAYEALEGFIRGETVAN